MLPKNQVRIRTQLSAAPERRHLERAFAAFTAVGTKYGTPGKDRKTIIGTSGA